MVLKGTVAVLVGQLPLAAQGPADAVQGFPDPALHHLPDVGIVGPDRALHVAASGHHVIALAGAEHAHGDDRGLQRIGIAADDGLQHLEELGPGHQGISSLVRLGAVAGDPFDMGEPVVRGRHHLIVADAEDAAGKVRPDVEAIDRVHILQGAAGDHGPGASGGRFFLRGLEDKAHGALQFSLTGAEEPCSPEKHGDVIVMSAGMHDSRILRGIGKLCVFRDGKRVHVRSEGYRLSRQRSAEFRNDTISSVHTGTDLVSADGLKLLYDALRRLFLVSGGLRVRVKISPEFNKMRLQFFCCFPNVHVSSFPFGPFGTRLHISFKSCAPHTVRCRTTYSSLFYHSCARIGELSAPFPDRPAVFLSAGFCYTN